jgi:hypothetical protein
VLGLAEWLRLGLIEGLILELTVCEPVFDLVTLFVTVCALRVTLFVLVVASATSGKEQISTLRTTAVIKTVR